MKRIYFLYSCLMILVANVNLLFSHDFRINIKNLKVTNYKLDIGIDYSSQELSAKCKMTVMNQSDRSVSMLPILLYRLLSVKSVTDLNGKPIAFNQRIVSFVDWPQYQVNYIEIELPQPIDKYSEITLVINYDGYILGYTEIMRYVKDQIDKEFTILREDCRAYPEIGLPSCKINWATGFSPSFNYEINVTAPRGYVVANIGKLLGITENENENIYRYANKKLAWRIDIAIAKYNLFEDKKENLKIFYFPKDSIGAKRIFQAIKKSNKLYSDWYGELKNNVGFTAIEVPSDFGSQADVSGVILQEKNFLEDANMTGIYHEMSHQLDPYEVGNTQARLNEGLATFHQTLLLEKLDNEQGRLESAFGRYRDIVRKSFQENPDYKNVPLSDYGEKKITELSYTKGMLFFTLFYHLVGEKEFIRIMRSYHQKFIPKGASLDDFASHIEEASKYNLTKLIQEWIFGIQSSDYILSGLTLDEMLKQYREK